MMMGVYEGKALGKAHRHKRHESNNANNLFVSGGTHACGLEEENYTKQNTLCGELWEGTGLLWRMNYNELALEHAGMLEV